MVEFEVDDSTVTVSVLGVDRILSLREQVTVDVADITAVALAEVDLRPPWVRAPGTFFPGVIAAGTYRGRHRKEFWDTRFGGRAIRIDLAGSEFTRLVVDVADPDAALRELTWAVAA
ncbi:hypothetical protein [Nocardia bovistercoris]|uniref:Bacterial Pleckstrin homology domain-containing protein n=1 Tax=Nocardia bovistercoris TaxID=2785916 RepID=A0A931IGT4_9NOCA|nr:hypothetical protein [Nocardia bovistercoris]MBH0780313.1 hypothetical protein [Nocardia bovistercoris]